MTTHLQCFPELDSNNMSLTYAFCFILFIMPDFSMFLNHSFDWLKSRIRASWAEEMLQLWEIIHSILADSTQEEP